MPLKFIKIVPWSPRNELNIQKNNILETPVKHTLKG